MLIDIHEKEGQASQKQYETAVHFVLPMYYTLSTQKTKTLAELLITKLVAIQRGNKNAKLSKRWWSRPGNIKYNAYITPSRAELTRKRIYENEIIYARTFGSPASCPLAPG